MVYYIEIINLSLNNGVTLILRQEKGKYKYLIYRKIYVVLFCFIKIYDGLFVYVVF